MYLIQHYVIKFGAGLILSLVIINKGKKGMSNKALVMTWGEFRRNYITDTDLDDKQKSSYTGNFLVLNMNHQMYNSNVIDITQGLLRVQP